MGSSRRAAAVALVALAACSTERTLPAPAPASIEPAIGYNASDLPAVIRGADFHVRAEQSVEGAAGTRLDAGFRAWLGATELLDVVRVDAATLTATVPAGIAGGSHALVVEGPYGTRGSVPAAYVALSTPPPVLTAAAAPVKGAVTLGDEALVDVTVTNHGPGGMRDVEPLLKRVVDETRRVPFPPPPPVSLAEGESFTWRFAESTGEPGIRVYEAWATGLEVVTGAAVASGKVRVTIDVQTPPALSLAAALARDAVAVGDVIEATLYVTNAGTAAASVVPSVAPDGSATFTGALALPEILVPGNATAGPLTFSLVATGAGAADVVLAVNGEDVNSGRPVSASTLAGRVVVQPPPRLEAVLRATGPDPAAPALVPVGAKVTLTMTVTNVGEGPATNVRPGTATFDAPSPPVVGGEAVSATAPFDLAPGASGTIVWSFDAAAPGAYVVTCRAESDAARATVAATSGLVVSSEVAVLAWDPLGDATGARTSSAFVAALGGRIAVGPDASGGRFALLAPTGDGLEAVDLRVAVDATGPNLPSNASGAEGSYPTLGASGCASGGIPRTCGPDGESARGLLASGVLGGEERLVYGGARDGELDYVYLAPEGEAALAFAYADLSAVLPASTRSLSAALPAGDRLYLAFAAPDLPALVALRTFPGPAGLDATAADAADLGLGAALGDLELLVPQAPAGSLATVDALHRSGDHLYVFGSFGCVVTSAPAPSSAAAFASCTRPSSKAAVVPQEARAILPGERAYPQVAEWGGRLLAARNTTQGPQLLACNAEAGGDPAVCEPGDWRLVAPNLEDVLDASLTQLDDPANHRMSLLLATERYLYVGYEGAAGLRVYRTRSTTLSRYFELTGAGGAMAGPGVAGLGGDGLGIGATRVYGALAAPDPRTGSSSPVLLVGDGAGPVRLVRLVE